MTDTALATVTSLAAQTGRSVADAHAALRHLIRQYSAEAVTVYPASPHSYEVDGEEWGDLAIVPKFAAQIIQMLTATEVPMTPSSDDTAAAGSDRAVADFIAEVYANDLAQHGTAYRAAYVQQYNHLCNEALTEGR